MGDNKMRRIAFAGATFVTEILVSSLSALDGFSLIALYADLNSSLKLDCEQYNFPVVQSFKKVLSYRPDIIMICDEKLDSHKLNADSNPKIVDYQTSLLLSEALKCLTEQLAISEDKQIKYRSALDAATDGVQIINEKGTIEYINHAFSRITAVHSSERIGTNIYDVSPDGAGAIVLKTGEVATGIRNQAVGSCAEVISNGAPIYRNNVLRGTVVTFQEVTDILRLSEELKMSQALIESLKHQLDKPHLRKYTFNDLIGENKKLLAAINLSKRAAKSDSTVLITGKSGTGKEIMAHAIHNASPRSNKPFVSVNCASIPDSLLESELFGHEKGAFTGADKTKIGKFQLANGGTLFLDEIGDLNFNVQAKLLRVLQEKELERVGSNQRISIDVRIIAATNKDLPKMVQDGTFREDLFYRLQVIAVNIPPLRERRDDIPALVKHLIGKIAKQLNKPVPSISAESLKLLIDYPWPGNVRELENVITRALMLCDGSVIQLGNLTFLRNGTSLNTLTTEEEIIPLNDLNKMMVSRALKKYGKSTSGKQSAAKALHISLSTLYNYIKLYQLD